MKAKAKHICLFALGCLFLAGCRSTSSTESGSQTSPFSIQDKTKEKRLSVTCITEATYNQYDVWDSSVLTVKSVTYEGNTAVSGSEEIITDYSITIGDEGKSLHDGDILDTPGAIRLHISKEGYTDTKYDIYVIEVEDYRQTLSVTSLPDIVKYQVGETFDPSGLTVSLRTTCYVDGDPVKKNEVIKDYDLTINGVAAEGYVFESKGSYTVKISKEGIQKDTDGMPVLLTASFDITAYEPTDHSNDTLPIVDNTITKYWETADSKSMTVSFTDTLNPNPTDKGYYAPDEVELASSVQTLADRSIENWKYTPSTGVVPLIVIPVITPGSQSKATQENWDVINKAFFGSSTDLYFESLHSYYYKSSYGQLDFTGTVTDYFDPSTYSNSFTKLSDYSDYTIGNLVDLALQWAVDTYNLNLADYDTNNDGYVDGIDLIYLKDTDSTGQSVWWAFSSTTFNTNGTVQNPKASSYFFAGIDFINGSMCTKTGTGLSNADGDAHVLIHETGHMLGLNDYYSYSYSGYDAIGRFDMMDQNTGDQNAYSKLLLGWVKPYIVTGTCTISIPTYQHKDAVIVIPYDGKTYKTVNGKIQFNVFDEYLVMDYYTAENLYSQSYTGSSYYMNQPTRPGGMLYHVDARLMVTTQNVPSNILYSNNVASQLPQYFSFPSDPDDAIFSSTYNTKSVLKVISNTEKTSASFSEGSMGFSQYNGYDEVRMIRADKQYATSSITTTDKAIFDASYYKSFSLSSHSASFYQSKLNTGKGLSKSFTVTSVR